MAASFERWMVDQHYRPTTVRQTLAEIDNVHRVLQMDSRPHPYQTPSIRRWLRWDAETGRGGAAAKRLRKLGYEPARTGPRRRPERKMARRSFSDAQWSELLSYLEQSDDREAAVLRLMASTTLRIGDALGVEAHAIERGLVEGAVQVERKGGAFMDVPVEGSRPEWEYLLADMRATGYGGDIVASYVRDAPGASPLAGGAAYQRVNRYLKAAGDWIGMPPPVHLHRIRRTVAVQALREEKDMTLVQRLLGHASLQSTARYVDEIRTQDVGELQRKLRDRREGR